MTDTADLEKRLREEAMAKPIITEFRMPDGRIVRRVDPDVIERALRAAGKVLAKQSKVAADRGEN